MLLKPYRDTLALPGIRSLLAVATLARIPIAAGAVVLTLHVVTDLERGYGAAGLIGAASTTGGSARAPRPASPPPPARAGAAPPRSRPARPPRRPACAWSSCSPRWPRSPSGPWPR